MLVPYASRLAIWIKVAPNDLDQRLPKKWGRTEVTILYFL
jgi:hypothetical protein